MPSHHQISPYEKLSVSWICQHTDEFLHILLIHLWISKLYRYKFTDDIIEYMYIDVTKNGKVGNSETHPFTKAMNKLGKLFWNSGIKWKLIIRGMIEELQLLKFQGVRSNIRTYHGPFPSSAADMKTSAHISGAGCWYQRELYRLILKQLWLCAFPRL